MSRFDDCFSNAASAMHDTYGDAATYTVAATSEQVSLKFLVEEGVNERLEERTGGRDLVAGVTGSILRTDLTEPPAKGDTLKLTSDPNTVYMLTQTPRLAHDSLSWFCEFERSKPVTRGGNAEIPFV